MHKNETSKKITLKDYEFNNLLIYMKEELDSKNSSDIEADNALYQLLNFCFRNSLLKSCFNSDAHTIEIINPSNSIGMQVVISYLISKSTIFWKCLAMLKVTTIN